MGVRTFSLPLALSLFAGCGGDDGSPTSMGGTIGVSFTFTGGATTDAETSSEGTTGDDSGTTTSTSTSTTTSTETTTTETSTTDDSTTSTTTSGTTGPKFDIDPSGGTGPEPTDGDEKGCKGIDFLFVIDNSGSMADEQQNLISSFPGFITSIQTKLAELEADDFHILVTDTDAIPTNQNCELTCQLGGGECDGIPCVYFTDPACEATCQADPNASCGATTCASIFAAAGCGNSSCGCRLGAGLRVSEQMQECTPTPVQGPQHYIVQGQPDLTNVFSCIASRGTEGSGAELQAQSVVSAVGGTLGGVGQCNEGFIRPEAILVVVLVTDEEDSPSDPNGFSPGDPAGWKTAVLAAKGNDETGIVTLGLIGDIGWQAPLPTPICDPLQGIQGAEESPRLTQFMSSFQNHVLGSVCSPNYNDFFQQAVDLIEATCGDFEPPG